MLKKYRRTAAVSAALLMLSGCGKLIPTAREITDFQLISVVGVDKSEDEGILLTLSAKESAGAESKGGATSSKPLLMSSRSATVARAFQNMETYGDKHVYLGHAHYYLIGERLAKSGLEECLDYMLRDADARMDTRLYVVKDADAQELLSKASDNKAFAADRLSSLEQDIRRTSVTDSVSLLDIAGALNGGRAAVLPALKLSESQTHDPSRPEGKSEPKHSVPDGEDMERLAFDPDGFAIIENFKATEYIDKEHAAFLNILRGRFYNDVIEVSTSDGNPAALHIGQMKCGYRLVWKGKQPEKLVVRISFKSKLGETHSGQAVSSKEHTDELEALQNQYVSGGVTEVLKRSQAMDADFIGIADALDRSYPIRFARLKEQWSGIWPGLPFEVEISSEVTGSFDLSDPIGS